MDTLAIMDELLDGCHQREKPDHLAVAFDNGGAN
jgi:hypothetical protein